MRRKKTISVPSMRPLKAKGRMRVTLGGRTFYLGRMGDPECEKNYEALVSLWIARGRPSRWEETGIGAERAISLDELIWEYWQHAEQYYVKDGKPTSEPGRIKEALRYARVTAGGTTPADSFGPILLSQARDAMVAAGLARVTVNGYVQRIRRCFRWGVAQELVSPSTLQALQALPGLRRGRTTARETEPVRPVPQEAIDAVLPRVSRQVAAMIQVQLLTGMRPGEVCIMRGCDIDQSGKVWLYRPHSHKTEHHGRQREILIGPRAQEIIRPFLAPSYLFRADQAMAEAREAQKKPGKQRRKKRVAAPKRTPKAHYDRFSYARAISRAVRKHNKAANTAEQKFDPWGPNRLRHNAATTVRREAGIEAARVILGHSSAVTSEIYAERDMGAAKRLLGRIG